MSSVTTTSSPAVCLPVSARTSTAVTGHPTYGQILKSTALIGGSSVVNIAFGIVRTKAMALFLGPAGVGLLGMFASVSDLTQSLAGLGIQNSGVRQIAEAVGSGEAERIERTATVLKRVSIVLGIMGALMLVVFARPVARFTFGRTDEAAGVALLSLVVLFRSISAGQGALIQGMRRIADLARMSVLAGLFGTCVSIPLVYFFREQGIVPSLVAVAASAILTSWYYSRKVQLRSVAMPIAQVLDEAGDLLKLGLAFMASGFLTLGAAYAIRIIVLKYAGVEAAGLYQAAWALGGLYVGIILQAMGADFYPRLTAVSKNDAECNRLVNEQAQISLLLAGPGVMATLTFASVVIALFYSPAFGGAVSLLRWICLGMTLRVVAFPMGYVVLAKGAQRIFFMTEVAATVVHVGLAWVLVPRFGVDGAGVAFFCLYLWHACFIYFIVRRLSGFRWSSRNHRLGMVTLPLTGLVFASFQVLPFWLATTFGTVAVILSGLHSVRVLAKLLPAASIPSPVREILSRCGLMTQGAGG
jgi:antigen flippase